MEWTGEERDAVQAVIDRYDFFQGYGWDE
jgi:hypothetical protein